MDRQRHLFAVYIRRRYDLLLDCRMARGILVVCLVALALSQTVLPVAAVVLSPCSVAKQLVRAGIPRSQIPDWLCLIEHESNFNTAATHGNTDGSQDNGLLQINDFYWCKEKSVGGDCKLKCSSLRNNNISDDIKCAQLIYSRQGFNAWTGWKNHCRGKKLSAPANCKY